MTDDQDDHRPEDRDSRHDLGCRHAEEEPVVGFERLDDEPDAAVPDEEDEEESPGLSRPAKRRESQIKTIAPSNPESDS